MTWLMVAGDQGEHHLDPRQVVKVLEAKEFALPAQGENISGVIPFESGWVPILNRNSVPWGGASGHLFVVLEFDGIRIAAKANRIAPASEKEQDQIIDLSTLYKDNGLL